MRWLPDRIERSACQALGTRVYNGGREIREAVWEKPRLNLISELLEKEFEGKTREKNAEDKQGPWVGCDAVFGTEFSERSEN